MNTVNLLTVDGRIGDRFKSDLTILTAGSSPTYCGGYLGDLEFQGSSSLILSSGVITAPVASPLGSVLATLAPQPYSNYCGTRPIVTATPSAPEVLLTPLSIGVNVVPPPSGGSPPIAPTGAVRVIVDGASCDATIDGAGSGSCSLTPTTAGMRTLTSQYLGDSNFSLGSIVSQPLDVTLEQPLVTLSLTPNPASYASVMTFAFNVSPSAGSSAQPTPTGSVTVLGFNNALCSSTIDNQGHGSCTFQMTSITPLLQTDAAYPTLITATYAGDDNYLPASSAGMPLAFIDMFVKYAAGPLTLATGQTATLTVNTTNAFTQSAVPTPPNLIWASSDPSVATVNAGTVTGVTPGNATITVTDPVSLAFASVMLAVTAQ
jgi:hypothetical protein